MAKTHSLSTLLLLIVAQVAFSQNTDALRKKIQAIVSTKNATVGVAISGNGGKDTVSLNAGGHYPLQSVFKFHIALAVLEQVDQGKFALDQKIEVQKKDLLPGLYSPLREANPDGGHFPISTLIEYSVSVSDNVGCDVLLKLIGGPKTVEDFFRKNRIKDLSIKLNEETQQANWDLQFQNWTTPKAANTTLAKFYYNKKKLLSKTSHDFIWKVMRETQTGQNRLRGQLPQGITIAHKTGTSGTNQAGLTAAVNDIGIVFLPNGKHFFISVFVSNSQEDAAANEKIIADIAKAAWDYFVGK
jgi:beta-lactamase class A/beta-lactamase class A VEB